MGRRKKNHARCEACGLHEELCLCSDFDALPIRTRVVLVMHRREVHKPTNTGRLARVAFEDVRTEIRGGDPPDLGAHESTDRRTMVLFPSDDARVITSEVMAEDPRPVTLFVPDGTWGQARRAVRREAVLRDAEHVIPPAGPQTSYQLRHEHVDGGLATAEALARLLRVLESDAAGAHLDAVFRTFVARSLSVR